MSTQHDAIDAHLLQTYLAEAQLDSYPCDAALWEIEQSNAGLSYLSHGFFRFYGKFPPPVASRFIRELHDPRAGPVVDPMVGSGTTLLEAALQGRPAIGLDVNPLALLVAKVKTTPVAAQTVLDTLAAYARYARAAPGADAARAIPADRYLDHWFYPATQLALAQAARFAETRIDDPDMRDFFKVALAAIVRKVSRASSGMGRMFLDPAIPPQDVARHLCDRLRRMAAACDDIGRLAPRVTTLPHDARAPFLTPGVTNLVICHPPYFNLYRYSSIYKYELLWLGYEIRSLRPREVREGFKIAQRAMVADYVADMLAVLRNIARALTPGGWCVLMIGDTILRGERINITSATLRQALESGLPLRPRQVIVRRPKFTEASYAASQRRAKDRVGVKLCDHVLVLERVGDG